MGLADARDTVGVHHRLVAAELGGVTLGHARGAGRDGVQGAAGARPCTRGSLLRAAKGGLGDGLGIGRRALGHGEEGKGSNGQNKKCNAHCSFFSVPESKECLYKTRRPPQAPLHSTMAGHNGNTYIAMTPAAAPPVGAPQDALTKYGLPGEDSEEEDKKRRHHLTSVMISLLLLFSFATWLTAMTALRHRGARESADGDGIVILRALDQLLNTSPEHYDLKADDLTKNVNLISAYCILSASPLLFIGVIFFIVAAVSTPTKSAHSFFQKLGYNLFYVKHHGVNIFTLFWGAFAEAPLFVFILLWLGARSLETLLLVAFAVALLAAAPETPTVPAYADDGKPLIQPDAAVKKTAVMRFRMTNIVAAAAIAFVYSIVVLRVGYGNRLTGQKAGQSVNVGVHLVNINFMIYASFWAATNGIRRIWNAWRSWNNDDHSHHDRIAYWFAILEIVIYFYVTFTTAIILTAYST